MLLISIGSVCNLGNYLIVVMTGILELVLGNKGLSLINKYIGIVGGEPSNIEISSNNRYTT